MTKMPHLQKVLMDWWSVSHCTGSGSGPGDYVMLYSIGIDFDSHELSHFTLHDPPWQGPCLWRGGGPGGANSHIA